MQMLIELREHLEFLEENSEWEHNFVEGLLIELEEGRDFIRRPLSVKQSRQLNRIYKSFQNE